jgi:elongation factor G
MSSDPRSLRNLAFVGHPSSGKTTLLDALAQRLGASDRKGSVGDKTSIFDTEPEEQEKQHTLQLAAVHAEAEGCTWNLIDTPGYPEFGADAMSGMWAVETVVGVVSCAGAVSFNLRQKLEQAAALGRGRILIVTHVDGENADFDQLIGALRSSVGEVCVPVMLPDQSGSGFSGVSFVTEGDWRKRLFDRVMDACEDEEVVMEYLESEKLSDDQLRTHLPTAIAAGAVIPVLVCNPDSGVGIDEVVTWLAAFTPNPTTKVVFQAGGEDVPCDASGDFVGVVFNVKSDPHVGKICLARVLSGTLNASDVIGEAKGEKIGGLFHALGGKNRENVDSVSAGEIAAFSKVEHIGWGQSFTLAGSDPAEITRPQLQTPTVALAVRPKSRSDEQKIGQALGKLTAEDPTFLVTPDPTTHELVISGMSDLHLHVVEARLKRRYGVEIETSLPRIADRETITKAADGHHRHKKQSGGRGQFGECYIRMKPGEEDSGVVFNDKVVGGSIPRNLIPAVEKGIRELVNQGILTHSEVVDIEVELYDGKFHAVDSDEASFKKAGSFAFKDGFSKAGPVLLEPIMNVEIQVPSDDAGTIFSDITSQRRGTVRDQTSASGGAVTVITAHVPLATLQTYHRDLKSQTAGEGMYAMKLDHYARVPGGEQARIIKELGKKAEEE